MTPDLTYVLLFCPTTRPPDARCVLKFLLFDVANMDIVFEGRDSRSWIRACCFSPDGNTFALASTDNKIYLYDSKSFALKAKVRGTIGRCSCYTHIA